MALSFFSKKTLDTSSVLLVDIGSASVGVARAQLSPSTAPVILDTTRRDIPFQESLTSSRFIVAMNHALENTLKDIKEKHKETMGPAHIFCALSSPWFILKSRRITLAHEDGVVVTEKLIEGLLDEDTEKLKKELSGTFPSDDVTVIERKVIKIRLNGYEIKDFYGKKTTELEIESAVSLSSRRAIETIKRLLSHFSVGSQIHFTAFPLAAFSAIRDIFPKEENFLFLDITGEATDVSLIVRDAVKETMLFPRGKNFFIREISNKKKTSHEEALSLFSLFLRDELGVNEKRVIENIINHSRDEWRERFEKALDIPLLYLTPVRKVFFTADADSKKLFEELIVSSHARILDKNACEVCYLDYAILANYVTFASGVNRDPFLMLEALFAKKMILP